MDISLGHSAAWGSFYCICSKRWGYACCLLCVREAPCGRLYPALQNSSEVLGLGAVGAPHQHPLSEWETTGSTPENTANGAEAAALGDRTSCVASTAAETPARVAAVRAEIDRILSTPSNRPLLTLGLAPGSDGYVVRSAFRRIALLIHPDKNPGCEDQCKQALVRAQAARELLESGAAEGGEGITSAGAGEDTKKRRRTHGPPAPARPDAFAGKLPASRQEYKSAEDFVAVVLQYLMDEWRRYVTLSVSDNNAPARGPKVRAAATVIPGGPEAVIRSELALGQTANSVKKLQRLVKNGLLGSDALENIDKMCCKVMEREYTLASQVYMQIAIGNAAWIMEVPSVMEAGMAGASGKERGAYFKQARMASKLNAKKGGSPMDDGEVRQHIVALKRLLTVAQELFPNSDVSKNTG